MDWTSFIQELKKLSARIDYRPDIVVGIARGGVIPARLLATELNIDTMYFLTVRKQGDQRRVVTEVLDDLVDRNILLVEDALETGKSLIAAKEYLIAKGARVKTACLYYTPASIIIPDFYLEKVDKLPRFPWEQQTF